MDMSWINPLIWLDYVKRDRSENTRCHKPACIICSNLLYCTVFDLYTQQVRIIDLWRSWYSVLVTPPAWAASEITIQWVLL